MTEARPASVVIQRRIEWIDTDAAGHYHYSTAFRLSEAAEAVLHDRLGIRDETFGRTPRVRVSADLRGTLHFHDLVDTTYEVTRVGRSSVSYGFRIHRGDLLAVEGEVVSVLLDRAEGDLVPWPDHWREQLLSAGPQAPELLQSADAKGALP